MGFDYALVHLKYTIPPAIALTWLFKPIGTLTDAYRIAWLVVIAVCSTCPWDSYLIRHRVWTYPPNAIVGPKLFQIPAEEVFFFFVQTYCTSLLYLLLSRPVFHPAHLPCPTAKEGPGSGNKRWLQHAVGAFIAAATSLAAYQVYVGKQGTYMGLIVVWVAPFIFLLWMLSGSFMLRLPSSSIILPVAASTLYLWVVDTLALKRGTWVIEKGTKLDVHLWPGLDIEEAVFFLLTNLLVVLGQVAFDHAIAILEACPETFPLVPSIPSPALLMRALFTDPASSEKARARIEAFQDAQNRLNKKSRSFFLASSFFRGRLRQDLISLYSFCRVADDLVDDAPTVEAASGSVGKLRKYLDLAFLAQKATGEKRSELNQGLQDLVKTFPPDTHSALLHLPWDRLPQTPLYELLDGFDSDIAFSQQASKTGGTTGLRAWPISDARDLETYASRVAATVAELSIVLVFFHATAARGGSRDSSLQCTRDVLQAGRKMGLALQYVNIARDIIVDAHINRVYIPTTWLEETGMTPEQVIAFAEGTGSHTLESKVAIDSLRQRLLDEADRNYRESRDSIRELPKQGRAPIRVAVESYMEIGRTLRNSRQVSYRIKSDGRATVPRLRRLSVAWRALSEG
ncbi:BcPHS1, phytoene synthase [Moelleriella libera RCEF 2490]|uniref:Bifunctional lycopene cyclase/phytoene synthase n=1 Tax=Moelleriella libera RCEF 2490 TaxID=1081109 RepID=A0A168EUJ7_9HYPO|nr:BcPHS1, phytoene synthase [Moelleriella libera RCEF 2490]